MSVKKTFTCTNCGKKHAFGAYVAAHAHVLLTHTCECGQKHSILDYRVKPLREKAGK